MSQQKVIIQQRHRISCSALEAVKRGDWDSPWFMHGEVQRLDKNGGHRSDRYRYQPFSCNTIDCGAHGIVSIDWLEKLIFVGSRFAAQAAKELETA